MNILDEHTQRIVDFCQARDWEQFHDPKDLAISLNLEAAEVLEQFQWKKRSEVNTRLVAEELSDVYYWILLMSHYLDIDLAKAFQAKMMQNEAKYPAEKARGKKAKYTEYQ